MSFHHQHIVITGAASGIGLALVRELAQYSCQVLAIDKDENGLMLLEQEMESCKMQIQSLALDLTNPDQIQSIVPLALEKLGSIDQFFANAGIALYGSFGSQSFNARQSQIMVNLVAPIEGLYQMIQLTNGHPFSYVITASAMAKIGMPKYAMYAATKSALDRFAECFRFEQNPGCHLMLVYPIATRTDFFNGQELSKIPWPSQSPKKVAQSILKAVRHKKTSVYPSLLFRCMISLQLFNKWLMYPYQLWNKPKHG
ncbi:MAG: SDR family NAD(P)-dependent oxidoreductase [Sediminibacterium sp.]